MFAVIVWVRGGGGLGRVGVVLVVISGYLGMEVLGLLMEWMGERSIW